VVVTVRVDVPDPANDPALKLAVAPAGNPLAVKATLLLNVSVGVMLATKLAVPPAEAVEVAGVADSTKSGMLNTCIS
jgi:predicted phosphoribosyltransferase